MVQGTNNVANVAGEVVLFQPDMARLNITWAGQNGDLIDPIPSNLDETSIKNLAVEAIRSGSVPGISAQSTPDFSDFVVDRFPPTQDVQFGRILIRPKTPFGVSTTSVQDWFNDINGLHFDHPDAQKIQELIVLFGRLGMSPKTATYTAIRFCQPAIEVAITEVGPK